MFTLDGVRCLTQDTMIIARLPRHYEVDRMIDLKILERDHSSALRKT